MAPVNFKIPEFRKKISSFLSKEDGRITKEGLLKAGVAAVVMAAAAAVSSQQVAAGHSNVTSCTPDCGTGPSLPANTNMNNQAVHFHSNNVLLGASGGTATGTHSHCIETCQHASHGSHGSHCSGGVSRS